MSIDLKLLYGFAQLSKSTVNNSSQFLKFTDPLNPKDLIFIIYNFFPSEVSFHVIYLLSLALLDAMLLIPSCVSSIPHFSAFVIPSSSISFRNATNC
jgi:hypothetical protein